MAGNSSKRAKKGPPRLSGLTQPSSDTISSDSLISPSSNSSVYTSPPSRKSGARAAKAHEQDVQQSIQQLLLHCQQMLAQQQQVAVAQSAQTGPLRPLYPSNLPVSQECDQAELWEPPNPRPKFPIDVYYDSINPLPAPRTQADVSRLWEREKVVAPQSVCHSLRGLFNLFRIARDGNCYWSAISTLIYGNPFYAHWVKAHHLAFFESVLEDRHHPRHKVYHSLARRVRVVPCLEGTVWVNQRYSLRQILHTPNCHVPMDICQVSCDLYDIHIIRLLETSDEVNIQASGPLNSRQVFLYLDEHLLHVDVLFPDEQAYLQPWEYHLRLPPLLPANPAEGFHIRRSLTDGHPFEDPVYPPLIPRPAIPTISYEHHSVVLGAEVVDRPRQANSASTDRTQRREEGVVEMASPAAGSIHRQLQAKSVVQLRSISHRLGIRSRSGIRKAELVDGLVRYMMSTGAVVKDPIDCFIGASFRNPYDEDRDRRRARWEQDGGQRRSV